MYFGSIVCSVQTSTKNSLPMLIKKTGTTSGLSLLPKNDGYCNKLFVFFVVSLIGISFCFYSLGIHSHKAFGQDNIHHDENSNEQLKGTNLTGKILVSLVFGCSIFILVNYYINHIKQRKTERKVNFMSKYKKALSGDNTVRDGGNRLGTSIFGGGVDTENLEKSTFKSVKSFVTRSGSLLGSELVSRNSMSRNSTKTSLNEVNMPNFDYAAIRPTPVVWLKYRACSDSRYNVSQGSLSYDCCGGHHASYNHGLSEVTKTTSLSATKQSFNQTLTPVTPLEVQNVEVQTEEAVDFGTGNTVETESNSTPTNTDSGKPLISIRSGHSFRKTQRPNFFKRKPSSITEMIDS